MAGSGYNQDKSQITPTLWRVTLTMTNATYYPITAGSPTTANGGVWPYEWTNSDVYTNATSMTATQATYLAQGNVRWYSIIDALTSVADCRVTNVTVTAANGSTLNTDATNQPTAISFTVAFEREAFVLSEWNTYLKSIGQSASGTYTNADGVTGQTAYVGVSGTAVTTLSLAIQDIVTFGITKGGASIGNSRSMRVYSPTLGGDSQAKVTVIQPNTPANIFSTVSATQISGTALVGSPI
jgi:hypothetical protein